MGVAIVSVVMNRGLTRNVARVLGAALIGSMAIAGCNSSPSGGGSSAGGGSASSQLPSLSGRTLVSGIDATFPPFEYVDDSGEIVGFGVDLGKSICDRVQCDIQFETAEWDGIFDRLAANEYDVIVSSATITRE